MEVRMKSNRLLALTTLCLILTACRARQPEQTAQAATALPQISPSHPELTPTPSSTPQPSQTPSPQPSPTPAYPDLGLAAESAVLLDAASGTLLYAKNEQEPLYPASTVKMMTALLALEYLDPQEEVRLGDEINLAWTVTRLDAQKAGLQYNETLQVEELLYALLLPSGSDAAFALAVATARKAADDPYLSLGESLDLFAQLMNERAAELGATQTRYINPDGYQDALQKTTAYDTALVAQAAMHAALFRQIVACPHYERAGVFNGNSPASWDNSNRLLQTDLPEYDPAAIGIKTGTSTEAGACLVSAEEIDGRLVIAVVLHSVSSQVWADSQRLLDYAARLTPVPILAAGPAE
jgi:D-alanyl-D-alanine carboxypeptidase (penicillin-binding protein 5/6)